MTVEKTPKDRLIASAADLFYRRGYHAVGVNELCEAADVRKGSFYYFFGSKQELAGAGIEHLRQLTEREILRPSFADDVPPADRLRRYFAKLTEWNASTLERFGQILGCPFGNMSAEVGLDEELIWAEVNTTFDLLRGYFRRCAADGGVADPDQAAEILLAYMEGALVVARGSGNPEEIMRFGDAAPAMVGME